jgi:hypothetical protein
MPLDNRGYVRDDKEINASQKVVACMASYEGEMKRREERKRIDGWRTKGEEKTAGRTKPVLHK